MNQELQHSPPRWAAHLLSWYCRTELLEDLEGDLNEHFNRNLKSKGSLSARFIYILDVLKFIRPYTIRKPQPHHANTFGLIQNDFKTSLRNMSRNALFTTINVAGLSVSMCVGLIIIAMVSELKSFDTFHENYNRTYRVRNTVYGTDSGKEEYASTSLMAAKQIKETVSGIEAGTIIRRGFNKDVHHGGKIIPLKGFWADDSFFKVFSFELTDGNVENALNELNSVVLTEKSALKIFGAADVAGQTVRIDSIDYSVSAVVKDPPLNSHLRFDMLGSFITIDSRKLRAGDRDWMKWDEMESTYVYITLPPENTSSIQQSLSGISAAGNKTISNNHIELQLQPMSGIVLSDGMSMEIGPSGNNLIIWTIGVFAFIVIISACFNYTNLSIARGLRRTREVGIRKVVGASKLQVFQQFIFESLVLSFLALIPAYFMFLLIRAEFISMDATFQEMVTLRPTSSVYLYFIALAVAVGLVAGILPALFFSKVNAIQVLKGFSSTKLFKHINLRKGLIVFQYSLSLLFIAAVGIEYRQYQYSLGFDLGYATDSILNIDLQENNPILVEKEFLEIPGVEKISKSNYIHSIGASNASTYARYNSIDSTKLYFNFIDAGFVPLYEHKIVAGNNFTPASDQANDAEVIINEKALQWMNLANPDDAIGEELIMEGKKMKVIGVVQNFNHDRISHFIQPFAFRNNSRKYEVISLKIQSADVLSTMNKVELAWKKVDPVHAVKAEFYTESIRHAYNKMSWMAKIIGSIAFLAIFIASLGLMGMVILTTETRLKEISIRKVLGASEGRLVVLMSKGFIQLLVFSAAIAIPSAYYIFDQVIFSRIVYRAPIGFTDLFAGAITVFGIALITIGSQTFKVARSNPAQVLKNE